MRTHTPSLLATLSACLFALSACAGVRTEGASVGEWTQDWSAAVALSQEKDIPLFVLFTGSDWCPYCVKLHDRIFTKDGWSSWAKENLVLAYIDFPNKKEGLSEAVQKQNGELAQRYHVEGFPTCFLLSVDSLEPIMTYGYDDSDTPESFAKDVADFLPLAKKNGLKSILNDKEWSQYQEAKEKRTKAEELLTQKFNELNQKAETLQAEGKTRKEIQTALQSEIEALEPAQNALLAAEKVQRALLLRAQKRISSPAEK